MAIPGASENQTQQLADIISSLESLNGSMSSVYRIQSQLLSAINKGNDSDQKSFSSLKDTMDRQTFAINKYMTENHGDQTVRETSKRQVSATSRLMSSSQVTVNQAVNDETEKVMEAIKQSTQKLVEASKNADSSNNAVLKLIGVMEKQTQNNDAIKKLVEDIKSGKIDGTNTFLKRSGISLSKEEKQAVAPHISKLIENAKTAFSIKNSPDSEEKKEDLDRLEEDSDNAILQIRDLLIEQSKQKEELNYKKKNGDSKNGGTGNLGGQDGVQLPIPIPKIGRHLLTLASLFSLGKSVIDGINDENEFENYSKVIPQLLRDKWSEKQILEWIEKNVEEGWKREDAKALLAKHLKEYNESKEKEVKRYGGLPGEFKRKSEDKTLDNTSRSSAKTGFEHTSDPIVPLAYKPFDDYQSRAVMDGIGAFWKSASKNPFTYGFLMNAINNPKATLIAGASAVSFVTTLQTAKLTAAHIMGPVESEKDAIGKMLSRSKEMLENIKTSSSLSQNEIEKLFYNTWSIVLSMYEKCIDDNYRLDKNYEVITRVRGIAPAPNPMVAGMGLHSIAFVEEKLELTKQIYSLLNEYIDELKKCKTMDEAIEVSKRCIEKARSYCEECDKSIIEKSNSTLNAFEKGANNVFGFLGMKEFDTDENNRYFTNYRRKQYDDAIYNGMPEIVKHRTGFKSMSFTTGRGYQQHYLNNGEFQLLPDGTIQFRNYKNDKWRIIPRSRKEMHDLYPSSKYDLSQYAKDLTGSSDSSTTRFEFGGKTVDASGFIGDPEGFYKMILKMIQENGKEIVINQTQMIPENGKTLSADKLTPKGSGGQ